MDKDGDIPLARFTDLTWKNRNLYVIEGQPGFWLQCYGTVQAKGSGQSFKARIDSIDPRQRERVFVQAIEVMKFLQGSLGED